MRRRTIILLLTLIVGCLPAGALNYVRLLKGDYCTCITLNYVSVDESNLPVVLSETLCYPLDLWGNTNPIKFVVLNNHGTTTLNSEVPSGDSPMDAIDTYAPHGALSMMCTEDALVIQPDYLGYGISKSHIHPYCNQMLTARNVVDGVMAALDKVEELGLTLNSDYYTYNVGYSQGGAVAMAVQRYLETKASTAVRNRFKLKKTVAGSGPYNLRYIFDDLLQQTTLNYPCSLPITLEGLYAAYQEGCMKQVNLSRVYVSSAFRTYIRSRILSKEEDTGTLNNDIKKYLGLSNLTVKDMFKTSYLSDSNPMGKALLKALDKNNLLDGEWIPQTPMILYGYTNDEIVQYGNTEQAVKLFGSKVTLYTNDELDSKMSSMVKQLLGDNLTADSHSGYGVKFYAYFLDGLMR